MNFKEHIERDKNLNLIKDQTLHLEIESYLVGGYVRDILISRDCKDIDIMTIGEPYKLVENISKKKGFSDFKIFKNFGTAAINFKKFNYEFVGARKESYNKSSRNPEVSPGLFQDDMKRRDFTINALAVSMNQDYGELIDTFNGLEDLKNKLIKTCDDPHKTFDDDPLRMMRAIRFATQLNFDIEESTFESICNNAERIKIISQERITDELNKIILSEKPSYGFKLLYVSGILKHIFPEMNNLQGVEKINNHSHKDNFYHTLEVLDNTCKVSDDLWLRWSAILHDIAKPHTKRYKENVGWTFHGHEDLGARLVPKIFKKLRLPLNHKMKYVQKLVRLHLRPIALVKDHITDSAIRRLVFDAGDDIDDLLKLCRADVTTKNPDKSKRYLKNFDIVESKIEIVEENDKIKNFQPPVSGEEIINIFAIKPSRVVGELKNEIKNQILDGKIKNNKDEALKLLTRLGKSKGLKPIK
ncbi:MAG: HD domain-containing protein [Bacteroidota bacterium]|nr:HD domain-containing protein [Bacteroidota bacterium]